MAFEKTVSLLAITTEGREAVAGTLGMWTVPTIICIYRCHLEDIAGTDGV